MAAAAEGSGTPPKQVCSEIQITIRIKECPEIRKSIISKVTSDPQLLKLHNELFTFDHIKWGDESQEQVYKTAGFPFVEKALQGQNVTVLAFGPTGSGKSYTMGSLICNWQNTGLIQRCLKQIFEESTVKVSASFVELYNKELHDLLNMGAMVHKGEESAPNIEEISSLKDGLLVINRALQIRQERQNSCSSSSSNTSTSQSHAWLTLHLKIKEGDKILKSKLNLVDLAGSRISTRTEAGRYVFGKKSYLNESLSALNKVMAESCSNKSDPMLSSKDSMLASVLKDLLDAKCLVSLIACISADPTSDYRSTFRTLRVAENIKSVQNQRNMEPTDSAGSLSDQLIPKTENVSEPESENTENIEDQTERPVMTPLEDKKIKKCSVVLKKTDVDSYRNKKSARARKREENITQQNSEEEDVDLEKTPLANVEVVYTAETRSTLSVSKGDTENADNETFIKNDFSFSQYNKSISECCSDDNLSLSSLEDMAILRTSAEFDNDNYISGTECQGAFHGFPNPMVFLPLSQSTSHESLEEKDNILANVSHLSITGYGIVNSEYQGGKQATARSEAVIGHSDQVFETQKIPDSQTVAIRSSKMKRMNAILTTDFSDSGPSQIDNEIPRKIMKLNSNLTLNEQRIVIDFEPKSEKKNSDDNLSDNMDNNRVKELSDKQNAHNKNILRILNTCTAEQLTDLPRVGFKTAVSIYQYRLIHGDFESLKSLESLPVWSEKMCQKFFAANNVFFQ